MVVSVLLVDCETVPPETHNTTLSPASRALERGRSVRGYPTHVSDPLSSFGHAVWRFLKVAPAGRYAALDLSDRIGADSCPCAFHWFQYLLGQPRLSKNFSRGASRGPLRARRRAELQASFSRPHRVRDCHHDHRCGALAAGFSEHQPVAVAHAMGLSTGRVLPSVAPALASVPGLVRNFFYECSASVGAAP